MPAPAAAASARSLPQNFQKAKLKIEGGETIDCLFNPTEYSIAKTNNWTFKPVTGTSLPPAEFTGGQPRELTLSLLLDYSLLGEGQSVRSITDKLFNMMEVPGGRGAGGSQSVPPFITFQWGSVDTFKAVCTSLSITFQLFHPNGEPVRAECKMTLKQAQTATSRSSQSAARPQNPTTEATAGLGVHVVKDGDSLQSIAYKTYGDANRWRVVAEANDVDNPFHLRRGRALHLPRLDA